MIVSYIPHCRLTPERITRAEFLIDNPTEEDSFDELISSGYCEDGDSAKELLRATLKEIADGFDGRRDVCCIRPEGSAYEVMLSGGLSWGADPTEACDSMWVIDNFAPLYDAFREWALEDEFNRDADRRKQLVDAVWRYIDPSPDGYSDVIERCLCRMGITELTSLVESVSTAGESLERDAYE